MTRVYTGNRRDVLAEVRSVAQAAEVIECPKKPEAFELDRLRMDWMANPTPKVVRVFIDPPADLAKHLKPRSDRWVYFSKEPVKAWRDWLVLHGIQPVDHTVTEAQLLSLLTAGSPEHGVPRFNRNAAEHFLACHRGGLEALKHPLETLKLLEAPEPVTLATVFELWPYVIHEGKTYAVSLNEFKKASTAQEMLRLVLRIPEGAEIPAMHGIKLACKSDPQKVKWIDQLLDDIERKYTNPRAAIALFALVSAQG